MYLNKKIKSINYKRITLTLTLDVFKYELDPLNRKFLEALTLTLDVFKLIYTYIF